MRLSMPTTFLFFSFISVPNVQALSSIPVIPHQRQLFNQLQYRRVSTSSSSLLLKSLASPYTKRIFTTTTPAAETKLLSPLFSHPNRSQSKENIKTDAKNNNDNSYYNDDAFGLIFLTSAFILHDLDFCVCFLLLSAIAAATTTVTYSTQDSISSQQQQKQQRMSLLLPGGVAWASFALSQLKFVSFFVGDLAVQSGWIATRSGLVEGGGGDEIQRLLFLEIGLCTISILWCWYKSNQVDET